MRSSSSCSWPRPCGWYALDYAYGWGDIPRKTLPAYIGHFALGMLVALWLEQRAVRTNRAFGAPATVALVVAGSAVVVLAGVWRELAPAGTLAQALFLTLTSAAGFALVIAAAAGGRGPSTAWLRHPVLTRLGLISYGVYLWHLPLLLVLRHAGLLPEPLAPRMLVVLGVTLIAAAASWRFVERPSIEWAGRRRVVRRGSARPRTRRAADAPARA